MSHERRQKQVRNEGEIVEDYQIGVGHVLAEADRITREESSLSLNGLTRVWAESTLEYLERVEELPDLTPRTPREET